MKSEYLPADAAEVIFGGVGRDGERVFLGGWAVMTKQRVTATPAVLPQRPPACNSVQRRLVPPEAHLVLPDHFPHARRVLQVFCNNKHIFILAAKVC